MTSQDDTTTPLWNSTTKLVVTLTLVAIFAYLIYRFQFILGPLLFAIILAYFLHPIAGWLNKKVHVPWRLAATLVYLIIFLTLIGLIVWGGVSLVQPLQSLTSFLQKLIEDLPGFVTDLSKSPLLIGPFTLDFSRLNLSDLWAQLQGIVSPLLSNIGTLLGNIASGAASTVTWTVFTLLIAYFIDVESSGVRANMIKLRVPRYQQDIERMSKQLSRTWNAFLRGQLTIFIITISFYSLLLAILGVKYFFGLALLAGLARFVPYVGPFVAWTTYGLVGLFQGTTIFGLLPLPYALIIVGLAMLTDVIMDNFVSPRIMSVSLDIHPAGVLIMVIIMAQLIGFVGILLSAPVLASLKLFFNYVFRKLTDQDPWESFNIAPASGRETFTYTHLFKQLSHFIIKIRDLIVKGSLSIKNLFNKKNQA
jgi:predicted PurR-regulated permease PerM